MPSRSELQAAAALRQITSGLRASQALYVAAELTVADHLAERPMNDQELASRTGSDPAALRRVMRALCTLDVFAESKTGYFSLGSAGNLLRSDVSGSFRAAVLQLVGDVRWRCWSDLLGTVRTGVGAAERVLGMELFDFYSAHPEVAEIHHKAMRGISSAQTTAVVGAMDFSQSGVVVDVGGGTGELLAAILVAHPGLSGVLFDLPHVVAHALDVLNDNGVTDRVQVVGGTFFDDVPSNGKTYLMKTILHDWDDARATKILKNCRRAMSVTDRLLIIERELPGFGSHNRETEVFFLDLEMLVMTPGGRERTRKEFDNLLSDTGFKLERTISTACPLSIFEATPV
jgi:hypothetical protein